MIPEAAIFDLDDTLLESKNQYLNNVRSVLSEMGLSSPTDKFLIGCTTLDNLKRKVASGREEEFAGKMMVKIKSHPYHLIPGASETLQELACLRYLWTSRDRETLLIRVAQSGLDLSLFQKTYSGNDVKYKKPDPRSLDEVLLDVTQRGITDYRKVICVSDAPHDIEAAVIRGLTPLAVLTGIYNREEFSLADRYVIASVKELNARLKELDLPGVL